MIKGLGIKIDGNLLFLSYLDAPRERLRLLLSVYFKLIWGSHTKADSVRTTKLRGVGREHIFQTG